MKRFIANLVILAGLGLAVLACQRTGYVEVAINSSAGSIRDPRGAITNLYVVVNRVDVRAKDTGLPEGAGTDPAAPGDPAEPEGADDAGGVWVTIFDGATRLDLVNMSSAPAFIGGMDVPAGEIDQVRLVLAPEVEMVAGGESVLVDCPSCSTSGLKVLIPHGVTLRAGESLDLTLDFTRTLDAEHAQLAPVIRAYASRE